MPDWVRDEAQYKFRPYGQSEDTIVRVTGLADATEEQRPKLLLEEEWDNRGADLQDPGARSTCIQSLASSMKIYPEDADWFTKGRDGQLQSITVDYDQVMTENPEYRALANSGDLNHRDLAEAKKAFPDFAVDELRTNVEPANPQQRQELAEAFTEARNRRDAQQYQDNVNEGQKSAHDYDLSQEYMR